MLSWVKFGLIAALSLTIAVVPVKLAAEKPQQVAKWYSPPTVRVCYNAPVFRIQVQKALDFWEDLGYKFGTVIWDDSSAWCTGDIYLGSITIMPNKTYLGTGTLGRTTRYTYNKGLITGAKIEVTREGSTMELLLEHELGHALGWPHHRVEGHVMHPILPRSGRDVTGLKNRR